MKFTQPRVVKSQTDGEPFRQDGAPVFWLLVTLGFMFVIGLCASCLVITWEVLIA